MSRLLNDLADGQWWCRMWRFSPKSLLNSEKDYRSRAAGKLKCTLYLLLTTTTIPDFRSELLSSFRLKRVAKPRRLKLLCGLWSQLCSTAESRCSPHRCRPCNCMTNNSNPKHSASPSLPSDDRRSCPRRDPRLPGPAAGIPAPHRSWALAQRPNSPQGRYRCRGPRTLRGLPRHERRGHPRLQASSRRTMEIRIGSRLHRGEQSLL